MDFPLNPEKAVVVMDCATYHHGHQVMNLMLHKGIGVLFTPPSGSNLNPV